MFIVHTSFRCKHCIFVWAESVDPQSVAVTAQFILREAKMISHFILAKKKKKKNGWMRKKSLILTSLFVASVILLMYRTGHTSYCIPDGQFPTLFSHLVYI